MIDCLIRIIWIISKVLLQNCKEMLKKILWKWHFFLWKDRRSEKLLRINLVLTSGYLVGILISASSNESPALMSALIGMTMIDFI